MVEQQVLAIGEIVLRVKEMSPMVEFYQNALGLELMRRFEDKVAFLKISDGVENQVQALTFFAEEMPSNWHTQTWSECHSEHTSLHHFALTLSKKNYQDVLDDFDQRGIEYTTANHTWLGWRGIYIRDPEGNICELVCYDESIDESAEYDYSKLHGSVSGKAF